MPYHCLIDPALASAQTRVLLAVAEDGLDLPAAALALHHRGQVGLQVVADDVLVVAVTVSGHDQAEHTVLGSVDPARPAPAAPAAYAT